MSSGKSWTKSLFVGIWTALNFSRKLFLNLVFLFVVFLIIGAIGMASQNKKPVSVPSGSALVLKLKGNIVIQKQAVDPFEEFAAEALEQEEENPEVLLQNVLEVIEHAKQDDRIKALVLDLSKLGGAGLDKLRQIALALEDFKQSDKPIYATGDYYSQNQYYLASHADHIYLNPMGYLMFDGYGRFGTYFKSALEKLKAQTHVFKVGTYKSAVEPFIRDDMSEQAKEANKAWLSAMWDQYKTQVAEARGIEKSNFDETLDDFLAKFEQVNGDFAQYALQYGWVDALKSREEVKQAIIDVVGTNTNGKGVNAISYKRYLRAIQGDKQFNNPIANKVGIVVAKGTIMNGNKKAGTIGGDSTAALLRRARQNDSVKSVVLYVDSPGGSAFASEVIRQEVENLQASGKPVVAVMSSAAASGGYWISAGADKIYAAPATITGSIGIFGMFFTFENTLDYLGIHTDGVGTTEFSGFGVSRTLDPKMSQILQLGIEQGYDKFISLVADKRNMSKAEVDQIAQGRVWIGSTAKDIGLVDELGYLQDGIETAAELANLSDYDTLYIKKPLSRTQEFWRDVFRGVSASLDGAFKMPKDSALLSLFKQASADIEQVANFNDPSGVYAHCIMCDIQ
jgi:protease-4